MCRQKPDNHLCIISNLGSDRRASGGPSAVTTQVHTDNSNEDPLINHLNLFLVTQDTTLSPASSSRFFPSFATSLASLSRLLLSSTPLQGVCNTGKNGHVLRLSAVTAGATSCSTRSGNVTPLHGGVVLCASMNQPTQ